MTSPNRRMSRLTLIVVAVLFLSPFIVALVLNRLGWHPVGTRNHGDLMEPPQPLGDIRLVGRDGGETVPLANPDHRWTLLVRVPAMCDTACAARLDELHRVRQSLGRHAPRLIVGLIAPAVLPPIPITLRPLGESTVETLESAMPLIADSPDWTGFLIDDKAYLMLRFPPDLEARLIRRDLGRLIR